MIHEMKKKKSSIFVAKKFVLELIIGNTYDTVI